MIGWQHAYNIAFIKRSKKGPNEDKERMVSIIEHLAIIAASIIAVKWQCQRFKVFLSGFKFWLN